MAFTANTLRAHRSNMLDCIRTFAVMLVLVYHVCVEYGAEQQDVVAQWFARYGFLGVDVFFPLSGFLITGYLLKNNDGAGIKIFFSRRIFRIMPLYLLALCVYAAASLATGQNLESLHNIWQNVLFLTGWVIFNNGREMVPYTITWSLSVEEFAYILMGVSALLLRRRLPLALIALAVFSITFRFYTDELKAAYYYPPARLDSIALGGLTAWAIIEKKRYVLWALGIGLGISLSLSTISRQMAGIFLFLHISLATCIVIYLIQVYFRNVSNWLVDAVGSIGFYSYFIYLFHYFNVSLIALVMRKVGVDIPFWIFVALVLAATYIQAVASFRYFEGPLMMYGRRNEARKPEKPIYQSTT